MHGFPGHRGDYYSEDFFIQRNRRRMSGIAVDELTCNKKTTQGEGFILNEVTLDPNDKKILFNIKQNKNSLIRRVLRWL